MPRDYYEILGVQKNADADTIKKAYRKLAMQFHPDRNPGNKEAEDKFKEASQAYEILSSPEKRSRYDQFGHAGTGGQHRGFQDMNDIFSSFSDIFGDIFGGAGGGGGGQPRGAARGSHLRYYVDVSLKEVIEGVEKEIEYSKEQSCSPCGGSGAEPGTSSETCKDCKGRGQIVRAQGFFSVATTCPTCRGAGKIIKTPCKKCKGQGREQIKTKIKVKIPPGVHTGTQLRLSGEGEGGYRGGPAGDLFVEIRVEEDDRFVREENDLYSEVEISYLQAILGTSLQVETVTGQHTIEIPAGTQPGDKILIGGGGIPSLRGYNRGDLYFLVKVMIPKKLNKDEEKMLREIAQQKMESVKEVTGFFGKPKGKGKGSFFNQ
ncbi:MAG: molecular chaperone DnaJ [Bdellovibrionales bacterium]